MKTEASRTLEVGGGERALSRPVVPGELRVLETQLWAV